MSDRINDHDREAYNREFCRLVSIFHDGSLGGRIVGTDRAGRERRGNEDDRGLFYVYNYSGVRVSSQRSELSAPVRLEPRRNDFQIPDKTIPCFPSPTTSWYIRRVFINWAGPGLVQSASGVCKTRLVFGYFGILAGIDHYAAFVNSPFALNCMLWL